MSTKSQTTKRKYNLKFPSLKTGLKVGKFKSFDISA